MSDEKRKTFDFSDVANAPEIRKLVEKQAVQRLGQIRVNVAIEVLSFNEGHGNAWQEPGDVHWMPGYSWSSLTSRAEKITACDTLSVGMVPDKKPPEAITCKKCQTEYAAWRLSKEEDDGSR